MLYTWNAKEMRKAKVRRKKRVDSQEEEASNKWRAVTAGEARENETLRIETRCAMGSEREEATIKILSSRRAQLRKLCRGIVKKFEPFKESNAAMKTELELTKDAVDNNRVFTKMLPN